MNIHTLADSDVLAWLGLAFDGSSFQDLQAKAVNDGWLWLGSDLSHGPSAPKVIFTILVEQLGRNINTSDFET